MAEVEEDVERGGMFRALRWVVLVGVAWGVVANLPGLARYLRMRSM